MSIDVDRLDTVIQRIATTLWRQYPMVERADLAQELWLWSLERPKKIVHWQNDGEVGEKQLHTSLRRHGWAYCAHEKAARLGYDPGDQYAYSIGQLEVLLPDVYDQESWLPTATTGERSEVPTTSDPAHGGNRLVMLIDVKASLEAGSEEDKALLFRIYGERESYVHIGEAEGISEQAARMRGQRALRRIQKRLGGAPAPAYTGRRTSLSNAAAQAITRNQEGEDD